MKIWLGMKLRLTSNVVFNSIQTGGGGDSACPNGLWTFITVLKSRLKPPNLVNSPKTYLETMWLSKSLSNKFDVTMATTF